MTDSLQKYLAELLGTFTLVFVGTMGILAAGGEAPIRNVAIAFAFGLALLAGLYAFADVSGGHFNPGVSLAMFLDKRLSIEDTIAYWVAQLAGAVLGSLCVLIAFDQDAVASTATLPGAPGAGTALFLELLATAIFVLVILNSTAAERHAGTALVAIPLTLVAAHLALIPFSGSSLNTARSFGPALIGSEWTDFWVYIVGPLGGAIIGWLVYTVVVSGKPLMPQPPAGRPPTTGERST
jgi:MIP family channel proteins